MPADALPPALRKAKHTDWIFPFSLIPRGATAFKWGPPKQIVGTQYSRRDVPRADGPIYRTAPAPIGEPESWQISYYPEAPWWAKVTGLAFYAAYSGKMGPDGKFRHWRVGTRWDDVDDYATILSVATRRFTGTDEQDTSTK